MKTVSETDILFFLNEHAKELEGYKRSLKDLFREAPLPELKTRYNDLIETIDDLQSFIKAKIKYYESL